MSYQTDLNLAEAKARRALLADPQESIRGAARGAGIPESTLRGRLKASPLGGPRDAGRVADLAIDGFEENPDGTATVSTSTKLNGAVPSPADILKSHGLEPDDWEIISVRASEWGNPDDPNFQLRVNAIRKESLLREADLSDWTPPPPPTAPQYGDRSLVICGDHHAPHHDKGLHQAMLAYLAAEQPDQGILLGDTGDFATISRHRNSTGFAQGLNAINDAVVGILMDYREASPRTHWTMLRGNHDDRLEYSIIDHNPEFYQVRPGVMESGDEISSLSLRRLWHLDDLGIDLIDEEWKLAKFPVTRTFTARHGYMTSPTAGNKMLTKHSNSQIQGHTHRMGFTFLTKHDPIDVRVAVEAGTMAEIHDGLGYDVEPNWQQGFITGYAWDDGDFALAPAIYIRGRLILPDGRRFRSE